MILSVPPEKFLALPQSVKDEWAIRSRAYEIAKVSLSGQYKGDLQNPVYLAQVATLRADIQSWGLEHGVYEEVSDVDLKARELDSFILALQSDIVTDQMLLTFTTNVINYSRSKNGKPNLSESSVYSFLIQ